MNEKIEKIVIQCIKLEHTELTYMQVENVLKEIIGYNLGDNIEYYIDESGLDGRSVEFNLIDISNKEYIYEIIINKKKINDRLNDIITILDVNEYNHQKIKFIFELLYEVILACFEYNKSQNLLQIDSELIEKLNETYIEKYYAIEKTKEIMIKISTNIENDTNKILAYLEQLDVIYEILLDYEGSKEVLKNKKDMTNMYEKFKKNNENIDEFLYRIGNIVGVKTSNIDNSRNGSESKAILQDLQLEELIDYIKQYAQISICNYNKDLKEIQNEAQKVYNKVEDEISSLLNCDNSCDKTPLFVENILSSKREDLINLEKIDPEQSVYDYLVENYPEVTNILSSKMDVLQFLDKIDNLPTDIEDYLKNEFLSEYKNFIEEIRNVGTLKQEELEKELNLFEEKYTYGIYYKYLNMTKKEKAEIATFADKEIKENLILFLNIKKELANISTTENIPYLYLFNYLSKREKNILSDNINIISILRSSLKDTSCINKYFNSYDVSKAFSLISNNEIEELYSMQKNIMGIFTKTSQFIQKLYNEDIIKCGMSILDILNFRDKDEIDNLFSMPKYINIVEILLGIGLYELYINRDIELNNFKRIYVNGCDESIETIIQIIKYNDLKYKLLEYNLKQKSALKNIKVKIPDILGINTVVRKIDNYNTKLLYINKDRKEIQERKLMAYKQREEMILNKINFVRQKNKI